jgi:hypothetical protein
MLTCKSVVNTIAILSGVAAGLLWWKSAVVKVAHRPGLSAMTIGDTDLMETVRAQSRWSSKAAAAATVAAIAQAVATVL